MEAGEALKRAMDEDLAQRVRAGDRTAEFELDRRWRRRLTALAWSILHDDHLAQDAAQLALWRAIRNLDRYDESRPFEPWILRIAGNCARDIKRERDARPERAAGEVPETAVGPSTAPVERLGSEEEVDALRICVGQLGERKQTVVSLFSTGFSLSEIGKALQRPKNTVQYWLKNALEQLARCMAGKGLA